jgi:ElaB/YqjD/DUF883 family membrane-anchored ribosome-binding protein
MAKKPKTQEIMSTSTTKSRAAVSHRIDRAARSAQQLNGLAHDAKDSIERKGAMVADGIHSLGERLQQGKKSAVRKAKRVATVVREKAASVDKTIRSKPYQSLGIAAGAGIVAGYLISRRRGAG